MQNSKNHFYLAWEKFLELVIFKQKAEALGMAKLLGHNMNDKILAIQLQADICLFFNDIDRAKELYAKASDLYYQNFSGNKAMAIKEHLKLL